MDTRLQHAQEYANQWLMFGETKHAALITLNTASITIMHNLVKGYMCWHSVLPCWLWFATVCCILSVLISLASFFAFTSQWGTTSFTCKLSGEANLRFFNRLMQKSEGQVKETFADANPDAFINQMAEQTAVNAAIALRKAQFFNLALILYILGPVLLAVASVILAPHVIRQRKRLCRLSAEIRASPR